MKLIMVMAHGQLADLSGLTITPPEHDGNDFVLTTSVTFTEGSTTEDYTGTVNVVVNAVIDNLMLR